MVEGWWSPGLGSAATAPLPWTDDEPINYLYDNWDENHGTAAGAAYLASLGDSAEVDHDAARTAAEDRALSSATEVSETGDPALDRGAAVFAARCANCYRTGSETEPLALASALTDPRPENFQKVVIDGVSPAENAYFVRPMPAFPQLTRGELRDLAIFSRHRFADAPAWTKIDAALDHILNEQPR